jgi:hypothetical protein
MSDLELVLTKCKQSLCFWPAGTKRSFGVGLILVPGVT